jgi:hypothetical protein
MCSIVFFFFCIHKLIRLPKNVYKYGDENVLSIGLPFDGLICLSKIDLILSYVKRKRIGLIVFVVLYF